MFFPWNIFTLFFDEQQVADRNNDTQLTDFIESEFLTEQVNIQFIFYFLAWQDLLDEANYYIYAHVFEGGLFQCD